MQDLDIPIFKKTYDAYKLLYGYRLDVPRLDRYTVWEKCENFLLDVLENIVCASQTPRPEKIALLEHASMRLNLLRVFLRLAKDVKALDMKKYVIVEAHVDEIGRMLGGWLRSMREK